MANNIHADPIIQVTITPNTSHRRLQPARNTLNWTVMSYYTKDEGAYELLSNKTYQVHHRTTQLADYRQQGEYYQPTTTIIAGPDLLDGRQVPHLPSRCYDRHSNGCQHHHSDHQLLYWCSVPAWIGGGMIVVTWCVWYHSCDVWCTSCTWSKFDTCKPVPQTSAGLGWRYASTIVRYSQCYNHEAEL